MASNRIAKLRSRTTDAAIQPTIFAEAFDSIPEEDPIKYTIGAMQPMKKDYTDRTFAEGDRIKKQLSKNLSSLGVGADFEYQGSVTSDTHIKVHSDLDLLTIATAFYSVEPPAVPASPYEGDPIAELKTLRSLSAGILRREFPTVTVDVSHGKCIGLSGGSLQREIDVVFANWWNTTDYLKYGSLTFRGVKVLDAFEGIRHKNKPFLHNAYIQVRDDDRQGNLRKMIRLLKSIKYDADYKVDISSYDISSIAYRMSDQDLTASKGSELILLENARKHLSFLMSNEDYRNSLYVPNGMRPIFGDSGASLTGLRQLFNEVSDLANEVKAALLKTYRTLDQTTIVY